MSSNCHSKLIVVKSLPSNLINISEVLKTDIDDGNRGILGLSTSGLLTVVAWIKKKVLLKHIEDVSDALWQEGGQGEIIAACHSGAMFRYTLHEETGLTKSLQLSSKSLLSLITSKDTSITSLKSLRIWGHTSKYILLQPQSDRLVVLHTNSESKPKILGIIKTDSLQSAHLAKNQIIVQPFTGSDLYIHDVSTCKTVEVLTLIVSRPGVSYIQWDYLAYSSAGAYIAVTDMERRLYLAKLDEKTYHGKKSGLIRSRVVPHQVVWPTSFQPSTLNNIVVYLSDELLSIFCSNIVNQREIFYYFTYNFIKEGGRLMLLYKFDKYTSILPGLSNGHPDLFLTEEGICMLSDKDQESLGVNTTLESEFNQICEALQEALINQDMEKIFDIKTAIEEDLSLFLSSCNHKENWVELADVRSKQHAELVNIILSYLTKAASTNMNRTIILGIKELVHHHIKVLYDQMSNVLKYVDAEKMAQLLLQMIEQMNFYFKSVESLKLPEGKAEDRIILEKFEVWADGPIKEILEDALKTRCVKIAEQYLSLKPWIYGEIESHLVASYCVDIARQNIATNLLVNMELSYKNELKEILYKSKELNEIKCLEGVLNTWEVLDAKETLAITLMKYVLKFSPRMISKAPRIWSDLVFFRSELSCDQSCLRQLDIGMLVQWNIDSLQLILIDLYARSDDPEILVEVDEASLWTYFLIRDDEKHLLKWITMQFETTGYEGNSKEEYAAVENIDEFFSPTLSEGQDLGIKSKRVKSVKIKNFMKKKEFKTKNLMNSSIYGSDSESLCSMDSTVWEGVDGSLRTTSESSTDSLANYIVTDFPETCFGFISQSMLNDIVFASFPLREKILNSIAQYGLFLSIEKGNSQVVVKRLLTNGFDLKFKLIKAEYEHKYDKDNFDKSILKAFADNNLKSSFFNYALQRNIDVKSLNLGLNDKGNWIDMIFPFQMLQKTQAKEVIYKLGLETISYIVSDNYSMIEDFFPVFLTMLFAPNATLTDFINFSKVESCLDEDDPKRKDIEALCQILAKQHMTPQSVIEKLAYGDYLFLQDIIAEKQPSIQFDISIYDLLRGTVPFDISGLFTWQKRNKFGYNLDAFQPSFTNDSLSKHDGVDCTLDYIYYLKAGRPTFALASILHGLYEDIPKEINYIELPVFGLALNSWPNKRVCSACVAILYLVDLKYELLRTLLYTAELITETFELIVFKDLRENLRNSQMNLLTQEIQDTFNLICSSYTRKTAALNLINLLEFTIETRVTGRKISPNESLFQFRKDGDVDITSESLQACDQLYYIVLGLKLSVEIASNYNLPFPQEILKFLVNNGEWFLFLTCIQLVQCPEEIVTNLSKLFKSEAMTEHMKLAFFDIKSVSSKGCKADCEGNGTSSETKITEPSFCKKPNLKRDHLKVLKESEIQLSTWNDSSLSQNIDSFADCEDVFSVIIKCHRMANPFLALLGGSICFRSPHLSIIATYYDQSFNYECLSIWLLVQIPDNKSTKVEFNNESVAFVDYDNRREEFYLKIKDFMNTEQLLRLLEKLISLYYSLGCLDILEKGFKIFDSSSPILPIFDGLRGAKVGKKVEDITDSLFKMATNFVLYKESERKLTFLSNLCIFALCDGMENYLKNRYLQLMFLNALIPCSNDHPFIIQKTDWKLLKDIVAILESTKIQLKFCRDSNISEMCNFTKMASQIIHSLISADEFKAAYQIAERLGIDNEDIFCSQLKSEYFEIKKDDFNNIKVSDFLMDANIKIKSNGISSKKACIMFESVAVDTLYPLHKYLCMQYAVFWAYAYKKNFETELELLNKQQSSGAEKSVDWVKYIECIEFKMWIAFIQWLLVTEKADFKAQYLVPPFELGNWPWEIESDNTELDYAFVNKVALIEKKASSKNEPWNYLNYSDRLIKNLHNYNPSVDVTKELIDQALLSLITKCWRNNLTLTACRISNHFDYNHNDVKCFINIIKLAYDCEFSDKQASPITPKAKRKLSRSSRGLNFNMAQISLEGETQLWLSSILRISSELEHCNKAVDRVLTLCRVADAVYVPFLNVIHHQDCSALLISVLAVECSDNIQLSKEFISAFPIPVNIVNKLLLDEVTKAVSRDIRNESDPERHFLTHNNIDEKWVEMISLSDDPSSLGYQLMDVIRSLSKNTHPDHAAKALVMSVELMIRAHDCFSYAAHMEGINAILQVVPDLTKSLLKHKQWALMGRLLTGIRRYQEMSYLIDILRENQQFEILLGKNTVKKMQSSGLDKALVHYLRSSFPVDKEMLRMVSLHFLMYSELAKMWEEDGEEIIEKVLKSTAKPHADKDLEWGVISSFFPMLSSPQSTSHSSGFINEESSSAVGGTVEVDFLKCTDFSLLADAMRCFYYASQYCVQEKQLVKGMRHSRKAELIALQISLVKKAVNSGLALRILNLSSPVLSLVLAQHLSVREIILVSRSYDVNPDWASALYFHYIVNGSKTFLDDFLQLNELSSDIVGNIVRRMEKAHFDSQQKERISMMLSYVEEVDFVYKISSQLNLRKKMEECLENPLCCYLKDTVFSQGITASSNF